MDILLLCLGGRCLSYHLVMMWNMSALYSHVYKYLSSIEYWFRVLDIDGDGVLSLFELVYLYEEVLQRLQELHIDCLSVENTVCQILDMINPAEQGEACLPCGLCIPSVIDCCMEWLSMCVKCRHQWEVFATTIDWYFVCHSPQMLTFLSASHTHTHTLDILAV